LTAGMDACGTCEAEVLPNDAPGYCCSCAAPLCARHAPACGCKRHPCPGKRGH
jgi:hypothetical protein